MPDEQNIAHPYIIDFLRSSLAKDEGVLGDLRSFAKKNSVPIIQPEVAALLKVLSLSLRPKKVLEIGTAIGYSAILLARHLDDDAKITTIERDAKMAQIARDNIKNAGLQDKINVIFGEAQEVLECQQGPYDMIFMDAAKSHYIHFLPHCIRLLKTGGLLISDNVLYGGMVAERKLLVRRKITIVKRLQTYINQICTSPLLESSILSVGDGVSLSYKKEVNQNENS